MFFIGQNLKPVHMTYSFLELLIFFSVRYLVFGVYFSPQQRNIACEDKQTSWETNYEIQIMNLFLIMMLKKPVF